MIRSIASFVAALAVLIGCHWVVAAPDEKPAPEGFDDRPAVLSPKTPRAEAELDRVAASALFAHGRMLFQREDYGGALRRYQRAWRYHPQSVAVLSEIVPLAFELNRNAEAARYAVIAAESDPRDAMLLRRLAIHLSEQKDWKRALALYERSAELDTLPANDASRVLLRLEMGRLYFLTGDYRRSADSFSLVRDALANPEKFGMNEQLVKTVLGKAELTYSLLAETFLQAERFDEALAMFQKSHEIKADKPMLALHLARVSAKRKQTDEALAKLDEYFQAKTASAGDEPYDLLAELLKEKLGDEKAAAAELRSRLTKLHENDPANAPLGYFLAREHRKAEAWEPAEKIYVELLKLEPTAEGFGGLIEIHRRQGQVEKLLAALGQAVAKAGSLEPLGEPAKQVAKDAELVGKLIALAKKQKEADPASLAEGVPLAMGLLAVSAKQFDAADEFFELALAVPKARKTEIMVTWGLEMFSADEFKRAVRVFRRAVDDGVVSENNSAVHFYLAGALEMAGQTADAVAAARQAASLSKNPRFQSRVPWILYHAKQYDEAKQKYVEFIKAFDADHAQDDTREALREARLVLSNICVIGENLPESEEWLEQVLDEFPEHTGAMNDLGYLWADQGKHLNKALVMVRRAVDDEPENMAYRDSLGWALYRLGRHEEAVKELEAAAAKKDPDGVILDHLGDAYLALKQSPKAIEAWRRAVTAFEKEQDAKKRTQVEAKLKQHAS